MKFWGRSTISPKLQPELGLTRLPALLQKGCRRVVERLSPRQETAEAGSSYVCAAISCEIRVH
jgi:hypothetical protein